jgi:hypothetical protein
MSGEVAAVRAEDMRLGVVRGAGGDGRAEDVGSALHPVFAVAADAAAPQGLRHALPGLPHARGLQHESLRRFNPEACAREYIALYEKMLNRALVRDFSGGKA